MAKTKKNKKAKKPEVKVEDFRKDKFVEMGFSSEDAYSLAKARDTSTGQLVDSYKIKRAITLGCPLDTAVQIWT